MSAAQFIQIHQPDSARLAAEAKAGLMRAAAQVSPKFLYDALGSRLFDAITELDEYYPTRTEAALLVRHADAIAAAVHAAAGPGATLVDLGAGSCSKAAGLFNSLAPAAYVAVDISVDFLQHAVATLQRQYPSVRMTGVGLDFSQHLALPAGLVPGRAVVFYPGSSIGNFDPDEALTLLRQAHALSAGGALLIGVDLVKPAAVLEAAYDDALGVTAAFNLNLLNHLNRLVGANFKVRDWRHVALFNAAQSRIEMHLEARCDITVNWPGGRRCFVAGERVHTENSHKWRRADFETLLRSAGWRQVRSFTDEREWFALMVASAA